MEEFLPSEIARAVYGYLLSEGCGAAARTFLDTSPNLVECKERVKHGKRLTHANTLLLGKNLVEVLNIACSVHSIVKEIRDKQQRGLRADTNESLTELLEQLRTCVLSESINNTRIEENGLSQPASQTESQNSDAPIYNLRTPSGTPTRAPSMAENYRNLAQECNEGLDLSLSPEKQLQKTRDGEVIFRQPFMRPTSAPGALGLSQLEMDNESAVAAITGIGSGTRPVPRAAPVVSTMSEIGLPSSTVHLSAPSSVQIVQNQLSVSTVTIPPNPLNSSVMQMTVAGKSSPQMIQSLSVNNIMSSRSQAVPSSPVCSVELSPSSEVLPPSYSADQSTAPTANANTFVQTTDVQEQPETAENNRNLLATVRLPDPPILVLDNQNQPVISLEGADDGGSYFNLSPSAASTPHPHPKFMPEDTAFIIYPPVTTDPPPKKTRLKNNGQALRRSGRLRKLLPKPHRQDPPHIIHVKVLPQTIEEDEDDSEEVDNNEMELARQLPNLDFMKKEDITTNKENENERYTNNEVIATTSDKENISEENILKEKSAEKLGSNLITERDKEKETSTPKPPALRKNISRSTPRRNSHVRALSFNTPLKPTLNRKANTSPKMPRIKFSPRSAKLSNVKRSSLFKSPNSPRNQKELSSCIEEEDDKVEDGQVEDGQVEEEDGQVEKGQVEEEEEDEGKIDEEDSQDMLEKSPLCKVPIATRSPAPKLSNVWKEVNDIKITEKPIWDEKIRNFALGDFVDPAPPPKKDSQEKQKKTNMSLKKDSPSSAQISPQKENKISNEGKNPKIKKSIYTPLKSPISDKTTNGIESLEQNQEVTNNISASSSNKIKINKRKKGNISPVKNRSCESSSSTSNENSTNCRTVSYSSQDNQSSGNNSVVTIINQQDSETVTVNIESREREDSPQSNNILLEDLVVSSNSCFPQTNDEVINENSKLIKEPATQIIIDSQKETANNSVSVDKVHCMNSSPTFNQPYVVALETPLKEFQVSKINSLNTPLIKSIRQETSVLEEDLLLTPSLPPTPQLNSSPRNFNKTPCKLVADSTIPDKQSNCFLKQSVSVNVIEKDKAKENSKEKNNLSSSSSESDNEINKNISKFNQSTKPCALPVIKNCLKNNIKRTSILSTSTDSSEDQIGDDVNQSVRDLLKSTEVSKRKVQKVRKKNVSKISIYTTTESSDDDVNINAGKTNSSPSDTTLSKLAFTLLENERKSLYKRPKRVEPTKMTRISNKKSSPRELHLSQNESSVGYSRETKKWSKTRKKVTKKNSTVEKQCEGIIEKSFETDGCSKATSTKPVTPEKIRQKLQSDLLKRERQMIFGDGFPSSSDSESDIDIFEKNKSVVCKSKLNKMGGKKKNIDEIIVAEESSVQHSQKNSYETFDVMKTLPPTQPSGSFEDLPLCNISQDKSSEMKLHDTNSLIHDLKSTNSNDCININKLINKSNEQEYDSSLNKAPLSGKDPKGHIEEKLIDEGVKQNEIKCSSENNPIIENGALNKSNTNTDCINTSNLASKDISQAQCSSEDKGGVADSNVKHKDIEREQLAKGKKEGSEINISDSNCNSKGEGNVPIPSTSFSSDSHNFLESAKVVENQSLQKENRETQNEIFVTSNSTSERIDSTFSFKQLDLGRKDIFQVNESKVALTYSETINHYSSSSFEKNIESKNIKCIQVSAPQKYSPTEKKTMSKQAGKRRIKLTPIGDDKYEQKLQVDYDVIDGQIINNKRGDRRLSGDLDLLDCSSSTIFSETGNLKKQSPLKLDTMNPADLNESKEERMCSRNENKLNGFNKSEKEIKNTPMKEISTAEGNTRINQSEINIKSLSTEKSSEKSKHTKHLNEKEKRIKCEHKNNLRSGENVTLYNEQQFKRESLYEVERNKLRQGTSHSGRRRERRQDHRRESPRRSYDRRNYNRRHSERLRREHDGRGFSERRNYSLRNHVRRGYSPSTEGKRHDSRGSPTKSTKDWGNETIKKLKENVSSIERLDLDRIEKQEKDQQKIPEITDPRAALVLTYSDVEKNESSQDEADSLMDFAVITRTKDKRFPSASKGPSLTSSSERQETMDDNKRKASCIIGESPESCQVEKKLKLGEVEMKEAKSVLKHKMADMLNVLHPDTSNEAS